LLFSDATVDRTTGQVTLRGEFPNPKHELLPGMYVRIRIEQGIDGDSLAVPQQAVRRNDTGGNEVYVLRADNHAVVQPVRLGHLVDEQWLVLEGLKPGDRVIVEGFQKFAAGETVTPIPWSRAVSASADKEPSSRETD
jgi:membrane fusion protein (multidrug efflux system)